MILFLVLYFNIIESIHYNDLNSFKKSIKEKYPYIRNIIVYSTTPPGTKIEFYLNEELSEEDVCLLFEEAREYILSENIFEELQRLHMKKYKYRFGEICIIFIYRENGYEYEFSSAQEIDGEASYCHFM